MNVNVLKVPAGIKYISDWKEYNLGNYNFPHILDKKLTGCGFTEYCIRLDNPLNIILCSPRRILLSNKESQHQGEIYYARNEFEDSVDFEKDIDSSKSPKKDQQPGEQVSESVKASSVDKLKFGVLDWYDYCKENGIPCKIIVTYDSFRHVRDALNERMKEFYTVIDEFQSIFMDSRFKSDSEIEFLNITRYLDRVCYVSATPMMEKYLDMLDEFKDLPYYVLDWSSLEPGRIVKPDLEVRFMKNLSREVDRIIDSYLSGNFESKYYFGEDGEIKMIESKEAVFYFNSVKSICEIIRRNHLTLDQVNVLCSDTKQNRKKVSKAFGCNKDLAIGSIPKRGEPHKMFTLCTRTVYLGSDFYSTCARSFIFSDSSVDALSVDISMDLNQILGRQRLDENPWKNSAELIVKTDWRLFSEEEFNKILELKKDKTNTLLRIYDELKTSKDKHILAEKYKLSIPLTSYKTDYVSVNTHGGKDLFPVFNKLVLISEMRTFEVQRKDYRDRFSVMGALRDNGVVANEDKAEYYLNEFNSLPSFIEKMRFICSIPDYGNKKDIVRKLPMEFQNYYNIIGEEKIISLGYQKSKLKRELESLTTLSRNKNSETGIFFDFKVGDRLTLKEIKEKLRDIYEKEGIYKTPKATDLNSLFTLKRIKFTISGKRVEGFELLPLESPPGDS